MNIDDQTNLPIPKPQALTIDPLEPKLHDLRYLDQQTIEQLINPNNPQYIIESHEVKQQNYLSQPPSVVIENPFQLPHSSSQVGISIHGIQQSQLSASIPQPVLAQNTNSNNQPQNSNSLPLAPAIGPIGVVIEPPPAPVLVKPPAGNWNTTLFDCFEDIDSCMVSCFLPCIQYGLNTEQLSKSKWYWAALSYFLLMFFVLYWIPGLFFRSLMRENFNIRGSILTDFIVHVFCFPCAIAQETREIKVRIPKNQQWFLVQ